MTEKIFINYRRGADWATAQLLHDHLSAAFGRGQIFIDVDNIPPGANFKKILAASVAECDIFLALIGHEWAETRNNLGEKRLDNPTDWVRIEIEAAFKQSKRIIPVLINNAQPLKIDDLPTSIAELAELHAFRLMPESFRRDVQALVTAITRLRATKMEQEQRPIVESTPAISTAKKRRATPVKKASSKALEKRNISSEAELSAGLPDEESIRAEAEANRQALELRNARTDLVKVINRLREKAENAQLEIELGRRIEDDIRAAIEASEITISRDVKIPEKILSAEARPRINNWERDDVTEIQPQHRIDPLKAAIRAALNVTFDAQPAPIADTNAAHLHLKQNFERRKIAESRIENQIATKLEEVFRGDEKVVRAEIKTGKSFGIHASINRYRAMEDGPALLLIAVVCAFVILAVISIPFVIK